ncbi:hypothetical protein GE09DRAFT_1167811 [Coniochaeta sp. 2T2.1]|nr:hypothetical protein GE09DRAFT_1167811 [Coniochaeta sp. 2T2.1]
MEMEGPTPESGLTSLLTVIITTSPTPSAPTTDLISSIIESFRTHCPDLIKVPVIVTFDTYDHISTKNRLKKGTVTEEGAHVYDEYKENVKELILGSYAGGESSSNVLTTTTGQAEYGLKEQPIYTVPYKVTQNTDGRVTFIEPTQRLGFGLSVRTALRVATTPYVWIHQHDWTLISDIPLSALLTIMASSTPPTTTSSSSGTELAIKPPPPVQYICFPSIRMLRYHVSDHVTHFPALRKLTNELKRDFIIPSPTTTSPSDPPETVCLTPLFFWHDKPHLASRTHYLERIFPGRLAIGRGEFIEDRVGQRARDQMKTGVWERWGCWLYYPDEGRRLVVRHLHGRIWRGQEREEKRREMLRSGEGTPEGRVNHWGRPGYVR